MSEVGEISDDDDRTQPLDSQKSFKISPDNEKIWGRLNSKRKNIPSLELRKNSYLFGRSTDCDYHFHGSCFDPNVWRVISKHHFRIILEEAVSSENSNDKKYAVYLEDISRNGTRINQKVVLNDKVQLKNNDIITISIGSNTVFPVAFVFENFFDYPSGILENYSIDRLIGAGAFGEVSLLICKKTYQKYALKKITKKYSNVLKSSRLSRRRILNEGKILTSLHHPNIIKMHNIIDTNDAVFLVLEFMEGGELQERIQQNIRLSENLTKFYFLQIFSAVEYLHSNNITHRDIKAENILMAKPIEKTLVKLTDFGLSKIVDDTSIMNTICGTPIYQAPEIYFAPSRHISYRNSIDIWSLGVLLYYCVSGLVPFLNKDNNLDKNMINNNVIDFSLPFLKKLSPQLKDLIRNMLTVNPSVRPTSKDLLKHSWVVSDVGLVSEAVQLQRSYCSSDEDADPASPPLKKLRHTTLNYS